MFVRPIKFEQTKRAFILLLRLVQDANVMPYEYSNWQWPIYVFHSCLGTEMSGGHQPIFKKQNLHVTLRFRIKAVL